MTNKITSLVSRSLILKGIATVVSFFAVSVIGVVIGKALEGKLADLSGLAALARALTARVIPLWVATLLAAGLFWTALTAFNLLKQSSDLSIVVRRDSCCWFARQDVDDEWRTIVRALVTFTNNTDHLVILTAVQVDGVDGEITFGDKTETQLRLQPGEIVSGEAMFICDDPAKFRKRGENFTASIVATDNLGRTHDSERVEFVATIAPEDEERPPARS